MQEIRSIALWGDSVMRGVVYDEQRGRTVCCPKTRRTGPPERWG